MRALALLVLLLGACRREPAGAPEAPVRAFFAAVAAARCQAMLEEAGGGLAEHLRRDDCRGFLEETRRRGGLELVRVDGVTPDGREPRARLVRAVLRTGGHDKEVVLRVEPAGGRWRLVAL